MNKNIIHLKILYCTNVLKHQETVATKGVAAEKTDLHEICGIESLTSSSGKVDL